MCACNTSNVCQDIRTQGWRNTDKQALLNQEPVVVVVVVVVVVGECLFPLRVACSHSSGSSLRKTSEDSASP